MLNREVSDATRGDLHTIYSLYPKKGSFLIQPTPHDNENPFQNHSTKPHLIHSRFPTYSPHHLILNIIHRFHCPGIEIDLFPLSCPLSQWVSYPYLAPQPEVRITCHHGSHNRLTVLTELLLAPCSCQTTIWEGAVLSYAGTMKWIYPRSFDHLHAFSKVLGVSMWTRNYLDGSSWMALRRLLSRQQ